MSASDVVAESLRDVTPALQIPFHMQWNASRTEESSFFILWSISIFLTMSPDPH